MKNGAFILGGVIILIVALIVFSFGHDEGIREVCFESSCYIVEVVDDSEERARGLMFRENLGEKEGMLFVFDEEAEHGFWMKNTFIELDIIWIDSEGKVVFIEEKSRPCGETCEVISPKVKAKYVLEINGGESEKIGLEKGSFVELENG